MKIKKASDYFLKNPYGVLGISCNAEKREILEAADTLNDLIDKGEEGSYKTPFVFKNLPVFDRSKESIDTAMQDIYNPCYKLFWFKENAAMLGKYDSILEYRSLGGSDYDVFVAAYLYLIENDPTFVHEVNWIQVVRVIRLLCSSSEKDIECFVKGRILPDSKELINKNILKPLFKHAEASSMEGIGRITEILYIHYKEKLGEFIPFITPAIEKNLNEQYEDIKTMVSKFDRSSDSSLSDEVLMTHVYELRDYIVEISYKNNKIFEVLNKIKSVKSGEWDSLLSITENIYDITVDGFIDIGHPEYAFGTCKLANRYVRPDKREKIKIKAAELSKLSEGKENIISEMLSVNKENNKNRHAQPIDKSGLRWVILIAAVGLIMLIKNLFN